MKFAWSGYNVSELVPRYMRTAFDDATQVIMSQSNSDNYWRRVVLSYLDTTLVQIEFRHSSLQRYYKYRIKLI